MRERPVWLSVVLVVGTVAAGLAVRFAPLDLPRVVVKYGGSMLWALMIYWLVTTALPRMRLAGAIAGAGSIATAVEFSKRTFPGLDSFRMTLAGKLLLGKYFSWWDILAYWVAIAIGGWVDSWMRRAAAKSGTEE